MPFEIQQLVNLQRLDLFPAEFLIMVAFPVLQTDIIVTHKENQGSFIVPKHFDKMGNKPFAVDIIWPMK